MRALWRALGSVIGWLLSPVTQLFFTLSCGLLTLALSIAGQIGSSADPVDQFLLAAQLFTFEDPSDLPDNGYILAARVMAVVTIATGLVEIIRRTSPDLRRQSDQVWLEVKTSLPFLFRRHVVVCGLGTVGFEVAKALIKRHSVVAIEREDLVWQINVARALGVQVVVGDARDEKVLLQARADRATHVYCLSDVDSTNLEIAGKLVQLVPGDAGPIVYSSLAEPRLSDAVRRSRLSREPGAVRLQPFDIDQIRARALFLDHLCRTRPGPDQVAYYAVVGFGTMGQTFAREAGKLAHFENGRRLRMSVFAPFGTEKGAAALDSFLGDHPAFAPDPDTFDLARLVSSAPDPDRWSHRTFRPRHAAWRTAADANAAIEYAVNAEFLPWGPANPFRDLHDVLVNRLSDPRVVPSVVLCDNDVSRNIELGLLLADVFRDRPLSIYVYLAQEHGLNHVLANEPKVRSFGTEQAEQLLGHVASPRAERLAPAIHAAYARLRKEGKAWTALSHEMQIANEEAAAHADVKLAIVGCEARTLPKRARKGDPAPLERFTERERLLLAEIEHNRWVAERLISGWRFGERSDELRQRPGVVPWAPLLPEEAAKDLAQVDDLIPALKDLGEGVYRRG